MNLTEVRPFDSSYWVVPRTFLAGHYPGAPTPERAQEKLGALQAAGIKQVVNLMEPGETNRDGVPFRPYESELKSRGLSCVRIAIPDVSVPTVSVMRAILDEIDTSIAQGRPVYVHCRGGKGRTGTVVGGWLIRHGLARPEEAVERVATLQGPARTLLSPSPETPEQGRFVARWGAGQ